MRCRNVDPECGKLFCTSCCARYDYFEFDEDSRSFICPVCIGICSCSICLRKRGLGDLVAKPFSMGGRAATAARPEGSVQKYLERMADPGFDRVRIVCRDDDIVTAPLPPEWIAWIDEKEGKNRPPTTFGAGKGKGKGGKGRKSQAAGNETGDTSPRKANGEPKKKRRKTASKNDVESIVLRIPALGRPSVDAIEQVDSPREKVVDSDGDTVDAYSDDDQAIPRPLPTPLLAIRPQFHQRMNLPGDGTGAPRRSATPSSDASATSERAYGFSFEEQGPPNPSINDFLASLHPTPADSHLLEQSGSSISLEIDVESTTMDMEMTLDNPADFTPTSAAQAQVMDSITLTPAPPRGLSTLSMNLSTLGEEIAVNEPRTPVTPLTPHAVAHGPVSRNRTHTPLTPGAGLSLARLLPDRLLMSQGDPLADVYFDQPSIVRELPLTERREPSPPMQPSGVMSVAALVGDASVGSNEANMNRFSGYNGEYGGARASTSLSPTSHTTPRRRRPPPPAANIVRAPKHAPDLSPRPPPHGSALPDERVYTAETQQRE